MKKVDSPYIEPRRLAEAIGIMCCLLFQLVDSTRVRILCVVIQLMPTQSGCFSPGGKPDNRRLTTRCLVKQQLPAVTGWDGGCGAARPGRNRVCSFLGRKPPGCRVRRLRVFVGVIGMASARFITNCQVAWIAAQRIPLQGVLFRFKGTALPVKERAWQS